MSRMLHIIIITICITYNVDIFNICISLLYAVIYVANVICNICISSLYAVIYVANVICNIYIIFVPHDYM